MQHHGLEKVEYIGHAVNPALVLLRSKQLETRNWEISDFSVFKTTVNSDWKNTFNGHPIRNSKSGTKASF
jgi:hypothetical protein